MNVLQGDNASQSSDGPAATEPGGPGGAGGRAAESKTWPDGEWPGPPGPSARPGSQRPTVTSLPNPSRRCLGDGSRPGPGPQTWRPATAVSESGTVAKMAFRVCALGLRCYASALVREALFLWAYYMLPPFQLKAKLKWGTDWEKQVKDCLSNSMKNQINVGKPWDAFRIATVCMKNPNYFFPEMAMKSDTTMEIYR
jgi:hypothetical protein